MGVIVNIACLVAVISLVIASMRKKAKGDF